MKLTGLIAVCHEVDGICGVEVWGLGAISARQPISWPLVRQANLVLLGLGLIAEASIPEEPGAGRCAAARRDLCGESAGNCPLYRDGA